jgi:hypothetical protein
LRYCGKFTLAEDLSDISDITSINLSYIDSLEGECCRGMFFSLLRCSPPPVPLIIADRLASRLNLTHNQLQLTGSIQVLEHCPQVTKVNFGWCKKLTGKGPREMPALFFCGAVLPLRLSLSLIDLPHPGSSLA